MKGLEFVPIFTLNKKATAIVAKVERTGHSAVITRHGRPAALLQRIETGSIEKGKRASVTELQNNTNAIIAEIEGKGTRYIVTRFDEPVAILRKVSAKEFSL